MAIRDLLWACPLCGTFGSLRADRRHADRCIACNAVLRRGEGATIRATPLGGAPIVRSALEWQNTLPPLEERFHADSDEPLGPERVRLKRAAGFQPVRYGRELLGWAEQFGPATVAEVRLVADQLELSTGDRTESIPIDDITSIQPSSSTLQIGSRGRALASIRFLNSSVRLWEFALQTRVRQAWLAAGKGLVTEFQPVIRAQAARSEVASNEPDNAETGGENAADALLDVLREAQKGGPATQYPPERPASRLYRLCQWIALSVWRTIGSLRVEGLDNIPRTGPFLLVSNHQSDLDPMLIQSAVKRPAHAVAKSTLFTVPGLGWLLPRLNVFPVRRFQVDPQAIRTALRRLNAGSAVAIYIEGERSWDGLLQEYRPGTVRLVLKSGAPVIPVAITGSYDASPRWDSRIRPATITIRFLPPIDFPRMDTRVDREAVLDTAASRIMAAISSALP